jgi:ornithine decarboxylase
VVDLAEVAAKHAQWRAELPRVRPYFAVKCNDDPHIVATLARLGAGFDCASKGEMSMALRLGVPPSDIIFAHPAKQPSHIRYAREKGVARMTFDNEEELRKIGREYPGAQAVLRILTDDSASVCRLGLKFGAPLDSVPHLMAVAKDAGVEVVGISYHVGSGNGNAAAFGDAVRDARKAFDLAAAAGVKLRLLDIGGGFPGSEIGASGSGADTLPAARAEGGDNGNPYAKHPSFSAMAAHIRAAMEECFPEGCGVELMAEPGRFFVKSSHALAVNVVGKRTTVDEATGALQA